MNPLEKRIKYKFRNSLLLAEALTHPSLGHETHRHHFDNQRLEFLGDAVLHSSGPEHQKHFAAKILWCGIELGTGEGKSKKEAEVAAAQHALRQQLWKNRAPEQPLNNSPTSPDISA